MSERDFYLAFTDRHRGSRQMVSGRLRADYLPFIEAVEAIYPGGAALDLGCGRGEWLELLAGHNLEARGVDFDQEMVESCLAAGLRAEEGDAVALLRDRADESQALISAFHLVEHLPSESLPGLVAELWRVLKPGGIVILETPNPENILVSTSGFLLDPTHQRPVPLHLLAFIAERQGFARVKVLRLHEDEALADKAEVSLLEVLGGASPDYALVAQKEGDERQMELCAAPFAAEGGVTLEDLARRYDLRLSRVKELCHEVEACKRRLSRVEESIDKAEERAAKLGHELQAVYASRSWRLTRPMRVVMNLLGRGVVPALPGGEWRGEWRQDRRQLFVDVSAVVQKDARTGIQRVTRSVLRELMLNPPEGFTVEPVYANHEQEGYRYARRYAAAIRGKKFPLCREPKISYQAGDIFLGVDLQHRTLLRQREYLQAMRREGVRILFVVYDLLPILQPRFFRLEPGIHQEWLSMVSEFDGALCISRAVADELLTWLAKQPRQACHPLPVGWFHLGSDIENSAPSRGLPLGAGRVLQRIAAVPSLLMVGTVEPRKGHEQALAACELLWARGVDINLVIVGRQGWSVEEISARLREHPERGERLFWLEGISDEYLEKIYAASACLLAASRGEGFGLPLIEAARQGLPIIARDIPVFREVAGEHASYFSGLEARELAEVVERWLELFRRGEAPSSSGMPRLSWKESVEQLKSRFFGEQWYRKWLPDYDEERPQVSLIVLNYNKPEMTLACLESLWRHTRGRRYEIVLVDNGSSPENFARLAPAMAGARVLRLEENRFFGEGNNLGFEFSRAPYVIFLNNDITATPGWLEPLIRRLEEEPGIGAVGPKLLSPDNRLQEAGAEIMLDGRDNRFGRGADPDDPRHNRERAVMYVSAAAMALRRESFERVLGFDLCYEPAYYEDCDLCLKIGQLGKRVVYCPESTIVHHENVTTSDPAANLGLNGLVELNRERFLARWLPVLRGEARELPGLIPEPSPPPQRVEGRPSLLLFTPYPLTPGGGERYLLTIAAALADSFNVTLLTPQPYSRLRLRTLGRELALDLDGIFLASGSDAVERGDWGIVMGNELLPPIPGPGRRNIFICQFPFPAPRQLLAQREAHAGEYRQVVLYSDFVRHHYLAGMKELGLEPPAVEIISPPALVKGGGPLSRGSADCGEGSGGCSHGKKILGVEGSGGCSPGKKILGVGRFFTGGHDKRHDLMIEAFARLVEQHPEAELHLAGSIPPVEEFREHFAGLQRSAEGLPVFFHPNVAAEKLERLYAEASLYWHLAGYGVDENLEPQRCEHFGITVVEAMARGCIPLVVKRGGPPEIVEHGVSGYHFESLDELVDLSRGLLARPGDDPEVEAMREAARRAGLRYGTEEFITSFRRLLNG